MIAAVVVVFVSLLVHYFTVQPELPASIPTGTSATAAILTMVAFAPWTYVGFDSIPQLAGEFNFSVVGDYRSNLDLYDDDGSHRYRYRHGSCCI